MTFVVPEYSRGRVRNAGEVLCQGDSYAIAEAMPVITNWRAAHAYPLNTFQATLRRRLKTIGTRAAERSLVGERLKRLPSIEAKLRRQQGMKLERMQDIAGLRAVVPDMGILRKLLSMYSEGRLTHELRNTHDYVQSPKDDGYRSVHLVYRYNSTRAPAYNGLSVELQMRTRLQHAWATGVETVDIFAKQAIKAGNPDPQWGRFFRLASAAFSLQEGTPSHPDFAGMTISDISEQLIEAESNLDVLLKLRGFRLAADAIHRGDRAKAAYHLVVLNTDTKMLRVTPFSESRLEEANERYAAVEQLAAAGEPLDPVLVAGGSVNQLRKTYPNYFLDAGVFIEKIARLCEKPAPPPLPRPRKKIRAPASLATSTPEINNNRRRGITGAGYLGLNEGTVFSTPFQLLGPQAPVIQRDGRGHELSHAGGTKWWEYTLDYLTAELLPPLPPVQLNAGQGDVGGHSWKKHARAYKNYLTRQSQSLQKSRKKQATRASKRKK